VPQRIPLNAGAVCRRAGGVSCAYPKKRLEAIRCGNARAKLHVSTCTSALHL
jgi:hypothetical protein